MKVIEILEEQVCTCVLQRPVEEKKCFKLGKHDDNGLAEVLLEQRRELLT